MRVLHMYDWSRETMFFAVARAESVAEAREIMLAMVDADSPTPKRLEAREWIKRTLPGIWYGPNAEFALTGSAELEEQTLFLEKEQRRIRQFETAVQAFLDKWKLVQPRIDGMFGLQQIRAGIVYGGPTIHEEIKALESALHPEKAEK